MDSAAWWSASPSKSQNSDIFLYSLEMNIPNLECPHENYGEIKWSVIAHCCGNVRDYGKDDFRFVLRLQNNFFYMIFNWLKNRSSWWVDSICGVKIGVFHKCGDYTSSQELLWNTLGCGCVYVCTHVHMSLHTCACNWPTCGWYNFRFMKDRNGMTLIHCCWVSKQG